MADNRNERIKLEMNLMDVAMALSEGNPGGATVIGQMISDGQAIDPDSMFGPFGGLLCLDSNGIYGSRIWMLYKDVCGQNLTYTIAALRAVQLGLFSTDELDRAIDGRYGGHHAGLDCEALLARVQDKLPEFGRTDPQVQIDPAFASKIVKHSIVKNADRLRTGLGDVDYLMKKCLEDDFNKDFPPTVGHPNFKAKSNAELADELGVSKRQVAKMRKRGEL